MSDRPATEPRTRYEDVAPEGRRISDVGGESSLVRTLSDAMLAKLAKNRGKRHWQDAAPTYLIDRLRQEVEELEQAIGGYLEEGSADENDVWAEAADVANFAAMLADNATGRAGAAPGDYHRDRVARERQDPEYDAEYRAARSEGAAPRAEGLDVELAAIFLAAAMKECGYTATEADARSILDYLDGDNGVTLTRRPSDERVPESECKRFRHDEHCDHFTD